MSVDETDLLRSLPEGLSIGGEWRASSNGAGFDVDDPATGEALGVAIADGTAADALAALDAAVEAQSGWSITPPRKRSEMLRRAFEGCVARTDDLALAMTLEMGKPLAQSRGEVAYGAEFFRWFAEETVRIDGRYTVAPGGDGRIVVTSRPVGPALLISPWNFPLAMLTRKIGAAAAAGCTMICKPSEVTPITSLLLTEILIDAGFPAGVCNLVTTTDASSLSSTLLADPRLRKISFTGSTRVGKSLHEAASQNLQRVSLELGGNAPFVVLADADVDAAVDGAMEAKMRNGGEACTSANRFLVHRSIAEGFTAELAARMAALRLGRGTDPDVEVGPIIRDADRAKIAGLVDEAVRDGAHVITGGAIAERPGWFYTPTVLADVPADAELLGTEIFGPVAPVVAFDDVDEAIAMANDTDAGLVSYLYTRDLDAAITVAEALEAGMVGINRGVVSNPAAPFGGIKSSGIGREGGAEGIEAYRETQYLGIALSD
ncbi:MAG TPA: NAD-dependent succinate-semialdehyde dehydrogenase [Acidimicrobiales bacterium]|nr:NAD-dependent succinate-semialdehyde dehydrogenase [Acidimicrobiales bacterium]